MRATSRSDLMNNIYPAASVYVHLARMETFGFSILEAMSHGLPVIATKVNAIPEMVRHEETGLLIDPGEFDMNSPMWADRVMEEGVTGLTRLLNDRDLRTRLGEAARDRVARAFSVEWRRREAARVYDSVLAGRSTTSPMATAGANPTSH